MLDNVISMKSLRIHECLMFQTEFDVAKRSSATGVLLCVLLGAFGAHHFYMQKMKLGTLYLLFCWTGIPLLASLIESFFMPKRIRAYNAAMATDTVMKIKNIRREQELDDVPPQTAHVVQRAQETLPELRPEIPDEARD